MATSMKNNGHFINAPYQAPAPAATGAKNANNRPLRRSRMWPFSKFRRLEREIIDSADKLRPILNHMVDLLEAVGGEFVMNNAGSGDITFKLGQQRFEFNQFVHMFRGFSIDRQPVPFEEFLNRAQSFERDTPPWLKK